MPVSSSKDIAPSSFEPPPDPKEPPTVSDSWSNTLSVYRPPGEDQSKRQRLPEDPDVLLAAQALGELRADFVSKPPSDRSCPSSSRSEPAVLPRSEPLLSLLTTSHPLVASTIGGASSAYGGAKNLSPRFKSGAEYVEGYLTPIANTVNSVGRVTGVEGGVRWFLGANRRPAPVPDSDVDEAYSHKRRKVRDGGGGGGGGDGDGEGATPLNLWYTDPRTLRRLSSTSTIDTLPLYDEIRSPAYTEETTGPSQNASRPAAPWQSRLMLSTSGLSVAMSAESLRSLKYCLRWLRWTNDHMGRVIGTLKATVEEYEQTRPPVPPHSGNGPVVDPEPSRVELVNRINTLKSDIIKTLQNTIETVSKYAGGALPENARALVRRHLTSLPQRFRIATMSAGGDGDGGRDSESAISEGAKRMLVLAKEGLDMVTQVSGVVDGTIMSAEEWCERMGRKRDSPRDDDEQRQ
ncbi:hypothetical protein L249_7711 [Ophiocordyceps polyrhachis-furcata BCC 54312]|uniref:Clock-controlled protein 8 n=1 Tax=Ophiocordyceps polyrhachis-furcata BCC 54312 TaxID=1330021 RepID=A0A367LB09_9HYPO|nr:hypothetical protein L249_7711 [Ophiocordyceps polyrhachis-furcata BCC 54312]